MNDQTDLGLADDGATERVEEYRFKPPRRPIRGYPELWWAGKRPFTSTRYYPAQLKETYGEAVDGERADGTPIRGWRNKLYWGDNLQVMSHLLKEFRGQVDLVYIDPPFDSKADYKKTVKLKGKQASNDHSAFEDKQYSDIWTNDEYLQFMMERLTLLRELLADTGTLWLHCDWHKSHHLRCILDEVFGADNFRNDVTWVRSTNPKGSQHRSNRFSVFTDTILVYGKSSNADIWADRARIPLTEEEIEEKYYREDEQGRYYDGPIVSTASMGPRPTLVYEYAGYTPPPWGWRMKREKVEALDKAGNLGWTSNDKPFRKLRPEDDKGKPIGDFWDDISLINSQADERVGYPTQKPLELLERVVRVASDPGDLVLDSFMGSGTTGVVATRLGRRFIGADINLGAVQIASKRLLGLTNGVAGQQSLELDDASEEEPEVGGEITPTEFFTGFEVYNVNHYDVFRNPAQAKDLLLEALEVQPLEASALYDGEKDGRMVKVMPVNRLATKQDLNELLTGFDLKTFEKRKQAQPNRPVEKVTLVCMGHDPELRPTLEREVKQLGYSIDVEVVDILRDRQDLQFKREAEASVVVEDGELVVEAFYPMNLLQKLSLLRENVDDWREMVESVMIDWNYDGAVLTPQVVDVPEGDGLVRGRYRVPSDAGTVRVKITDLLSESLEVEVGT